ncbi:hypothetical protein L210DRAFT_3729048 [Boletus edulis BED1]|nr:hypothetical protein L210DRAFT_3729048 [Boletus edulis BED1]
MTSYLRYIFGGHSRDNSPSPSREQSSKSHWRSRSQPTPNYIYATPGSSGPTSPPRLKTKRSNSYSARTTNPSPLRYNAFDSAAQGPSSSGEVRYGTSSSRVERTPLYRRASYKSSEHLAHYAMPHTPSMTPSVSFGPSSRTNSSSSLCPGSAPPGSSNGSSSHHVRYERRPSLRHNPPWQGSMSSVTGSMHSRSAELKIPHHPTSLHMHPLFASTRLHSAPISYDVTYTPSSRTVLDRTRHTAVPTHTLSQPATDPPTPAASRLVLRSDKFPWPVIVGPSTSSPSGTSFYIAGSSNRSSRSPNITNLDLLYSLHTTLLTRVTPQEWEALGHGSRAQRKVTRAYEKRCAKMGGGWEGGVRRLDWLHGKTRLIGIEVEKHGNGHRTGKLVFGKA